jgi:hypothetical protein
MLKRFQFFKKTIENKFLFNYFMLKVITVKFNFKFNVSSFIVVTNVLNLK